MRVDGAAMRKDAPRLLVTVFALGATATVSVFATLVWSSLQQYEHPPVPLTKGLNGEWTTISNVFDERVRHSFPIGTPEQTLAKALAAQGFRQADWGGQTGVEHEAVRREDNVVCRVTARVYWRSDGAGRLQEVHGAYREEVCL